MIEVAHALLAKSPVAGLFLSLALGYYVGQLKFWGFQLGGVAGSLIVAVILSQVGVTIDDEIKALTLGVFIYAVGYESGPKFFTSLHRGTLREVVLAAFLAVTALATVLVCAKLFQLNKGLAAGIAAGGLTQSAIVGTAGDAIAHMGLTDAQVKFLQSEVAAGFAVTYLPGLLGAILVCVHIVPRFMGQGIQESAGEVEGASHASPARSNGRSDALPQFVGRQFLVGPAAGRTVADVEISQRDSVVIRQIQRIDRLVEVTPETTLTHEDVVVVVGSREGIVNLSKMLGEEVVSIDGQGVEMWTRQAVVTRPGLSRRTIADVNASVDRSMRHGVFVVGVARNGQALPVGGNTILRKGDVVTLYGSATDTERVAPAIGCEMSHPDKTDFVYMGVGLVLGLLAGLIEFPIDGIPLTLGQGGGCLLVGLLFGWVRSKRPTFGAMPSAASQLLKDFGLAMFVAAIGLNSGKQALMAIQRNGLAMVAIGVFVSLFPLLLTMLFGRYVLRYQNAAMFAGALAGARGANPAFGQVIDKAGNSAPTVPFAITYAIASVLLALLGPVVIGLVPL